MTGRTFDENSVRTIGSSAALDDEPPSLDDWRVTLRRRFDRKNRELGIESTRAVEVFTITAWGEVPTAEQILRDFPAVHEGASNLDALRRKLRTWRGE